MYNKELVKEHKLKMLATAACAMICITLVGGYMYYVNSPEGIKEEQLRQYEITNKELNNIENIELTEWEKESIANAMLDRKEAEQRKIELVEANKEPNIFEKSIKGLNKIATDTKEQKIQVWNNIGNGVNATGEMISNKISSMLDNKTYLTGTDKAGNPYLAKGAKYTFKADGTPVEAPPDGSFQRLINPNGVKYVYNKTIPGWEKFDWDEYREKQRLMAEGKLRADGKSTEGMMTFGEAVEAGLIDKSSLKMSVNISSMGYK